MEWWEAVVLGLVQGLTEFLPISSSAHIRVVGALLPHGADPGAAFTAIIQIGTEAAVLLYFWRDIVRIVSSWWRALVGRDGPDARARFGARNADARLGWFVILGSVPVVVLGVLLKDVIETAFRNLYLTAAVLVVFGLVLAWADRVGAKKRELAELNAKDATALGFWQAMALIPGVSRSGGTISGGLFLGLTREAAARYSFLLAIPAVLGSGVFELVTEWDSLQEPGAPGLTATLIAAVVAFFVGFGVIVWFLRLITHRSFMPFVIYRMVFAGVIVALLVTGTISAT
ncbi:undecaprenyl-diphosphate phosphatase [Demequina sp.]|uniref:undecaprenyl-diphosphate phosphatase n=1 Tax=Demequina sp. TaxID=2050685 RepID=UPI003D0D4F39